VRMEFQIQESMWIRRLLQPDSAIHAGDTLAACAGLLGENCLPFFGLRDIHMLAATLRHSERGAQIRAGWGLGCHPIKEECT